MTYVRSMIFRSLRLLPRPSCSGRLRLLSSAGHEQRTTFGFREVTEREKAQSVSAVFSRVAGSYDLMNDAMSVGLHRLWKDWFVQLLAPPPGSRVLDVAGGTGDIALRLVEYSSQVGGEEGVEVTVVDASSEMLQEGIGKPGSDRISWVHGDALALPFPNNSFDAYTIAFGMRNVPNYMQALSEAHRVLVPGGRFLCMEFTPVQNPLVKTLYDFYSFECIPMLGELIAGDRESYQYLVESIRQFPCPETFCKMIVNCGFSNVQNWTLSMGIVAIHSAFKPFFVQEAGT